jgi:hypothetical protein
MDRISERDEDLLRAYRQALDKAKYPFSLGEILSTTVNTPAKRHYVGVRGVCRAIKKLRKGEILSISEERKKLINDILPRVEELEQQKPGTLLRDIVEEVLDSPAPEFYIKTSSAQIIIHHILKRLRNETRNNR